MKSDSDYEKTESSYEKINYLIRPAKQVERKLIIEALLSLKKKFTIENYQYVGMGSLFYVDYYMFHKFLGIKDMISMEKDEYNINRFKFNRPYSFIKLIPGTSTNILPKLDWGKNMFIWLDFDSRISVDIIYDIQIVCDSIRPGGIFLITIDAEPKRFKNLTGQKLQDEIEQILENFKKELHPYFPIEINKKDLSLKEFPKLLRQIIVNVIQEKVRKRKIEYLQIFNFKYRDTSQMYTFGCIFEKTSNELKDTGLFELDFVSIDDRLVEINIPIITPREKLLFDSLIPGIARKLKKFIMNKKQLEDYENYYKYYPQYYESLL